MKKVIFILLVVNLIIFFMTPNTCHQIHHHLSSNELKRYIRSSEENNISALRQLYLYYLLHKDSNSALMVACKGSSLGNITFKSILESERNEGNSGLCPKEPLKYLKDHSSWIPIQIRILWLCGKR